MPIISQSPDGSLLWNGRSRIEILEEFKRPVVIEIFDAKGNATKGLQVAGRREGIWTYYKVDQSLFHNLKIREDGTDRKMCAAAFLNDVFTGDAELFGELPPTETLNGILARFGSNAGAFERQFKMLNIVLDTFRADTDGARTVAKLQSDAIANRVEIIWALEHALGLLLTQAIEMQETPQVPTKRV